MTVQSISKLDAATRQLDLAISLYFQGADPLGILTLGGAAHRLLGDLMRHNRGTDRKQPKRVEDLVREITAANNFLKHADRDPNNVLAVNRDWSDFLIHNAIVMRFKLTNKLTSANVFFILWITAKYPFMSTLDQLLNSGSIAELRLIFRKLGSVDVQKRTFFKAFVRSCAPDPG
jgi:hypothetical protein